MITSSKIKPFESKFEARGLILSQKLYPDSKHEIFFWIWKFKYEIFVNSLFSWQIDMIYCDFHKFSWFIRFFFKFLWLIGFFSNFHDLSGFSLRFSWSIMIFSNFYDFSEFFFKFSWFFRIFFKFSWFFTNFSNF